MSLFRNRTRTPAEGFEKREVVTIDRRSDQLWNLRVTDGVDAYEEEIAWRVLSMDCEAGTVEMLVVRRAINDGR